MRPRGGQEEDKAWTQSPATELTEFIRGLDTEPSHRVDRVQEDKAWTQSPATQPSHVQGRGQDEAKRRRTWPGHRAQQHSPATELTEFKGAAKRRTTGGQGLDTEPGTAKRRTRPGPSHRVDRVQEEEKRRTRPGHRAQPQSPATELTERGQDEDKRWTQSPDRAQPQS